LIAAHLPTLSIYANTLREAGDEAGGVASLSLRFVAAATLALGELERVSGEGRYSTPTQAAANSLLNDLWRLAATNLKRADASIRPLDTDPEERERLEQYLTHASDRMQVYKRLIRELVPILFPVGDDFPMGAPPANEEALRMVILRTLTLGARA